MATEWKKGSLNQICRIGDGAHASLKRQTEGILYLTAKNITQTGIDLTTVDYIDEKTFEKHFTEKSSTVSCPKEGDILYSIIGSVGGCYIVKRETIGISSSVAIFRPDKNKINNLFLYYYIKSPFFYNSILAIKTGAAQGFMSLGKLGSVEVKYPESLETQQKIAGILSAYDDLIENNRKQIKLLEEAAQKLYKEWFVKLNFPGHENVKIVDGVPEGWKILTIEELLSEHFNGGWGKETLTGNFKNSGFVIRGTDINDIEQGQFSDIPYRYHSDKDIKTKSIREGDIIFELSNGNINNIGRTLLVTNELLVTLEAPVICASFCKLFRPKNWNYSILLKREIEDMQISKRLLPYKKNGANGINNFAFNDFLNHKLLIPEANSKLYSYLEKYEKAKTQIQKRLFLLQSARDELLPKLMNGEYV